MCDMIVNVSSAPTLTLFVMSGSASRTKSNNVISFACCISTEETGTSALPSGTCNLFVQATFVMNVEISYDHGSRSFLTSFSHVNTSCILILQKNVIGRMMVMEEYKKISWFQAVLEKWVHIPIPSTDTINNFFKRVTQELMHKLITTTLTIANSRVALIMCQVLIYMLYVY